MFEYLKLFSNSAYEKYSFDVIPVMGHIIAGDWKSYQYLVESIRQFPNQVFLKFQLFCYVFFNCTFIFLMTLFIHLFYYFLIFHSIVLHLASASALHIRTLQGPLKMFAYNFVEFYNC